MEHCSPWPTAAFSGETDFSAATTLGVYTKVAINLFSTPAA